MSLLESRILVGEEWQKKLKVSWAVGWRDKYMDLEMIRLNMFGNNVRHNICRKDCDTRKATPDCPTREFPAAKIVSNITARRITNWES